MHLGCKEAEDCLMKLCGPGTRHSGVKYPYCLFPLQVLLVSALTQFLLFPQLGLLFVASAHSCSGRGLPWLAKLSHLLQPLSAGATLEISPLLASMQK